MIKKIKRTIKKHDIFLKGDKLLLAVSGGPDSVAMLEIFVRLDKYDLSVAHFNHLTRGVESDKDEAFVKTLCNKYNVPFFAGSEDVKKVVKESGLSFQNAARDIRYNFLRTTAKSIGANKIVLAHHADDQVETVLINLLRGSGLKGISGMAFVEDDLARPMLEVTKAEIEAFIQKEKLTYRLDASNLETYYTRNRLRHEIVPLLMNFNPALSTTIGNMSDIFRAEEELLTEITLQAYSLLSEEHDKEIIYNLAYFHEQEKAIQRRLILKALSKVASTEKDFSYKNVQDVIKISNSGSGLVLHLPHSIRVKTTYGKLHFYKANFSSVMPNTFNIELQIPGKTTIEGIGEITAEYVSGTHELRSDAFITYIQEEKLLLPYYVRSRKSGDYVRLLGGNGKVKIKEMFIDMHIERRLRDCVPLVTDSEGEIIWVAGIRPAEKCRITHSGRMLKLTYCPFNV